MKSDCNLQISRWKKLTALALCAVLLLSPLTASAAVSDGGTKNAEKPDTNAILSVSLARSTYSYTGKTIRPKVTVTQNGKDVPSKYYTVTYGETVKNKFKKKTPKAMGYYTVKVTFKKAYKNRGTRMLPFSITPKAPTLTSAKIVKNKSLKITWKKVPKASGYTVWLVPADYGSRYQTTIKKNASSCSIALSNISPGEYYVYVMAYTKLKGKSISGSPSNHLTITITKQEK